MDLTVVEEEGHLYVGNSRQRLVFSRDASHWRFTTEVAGTAGWRPLATLPNAFVGGGLDLAPERWAADPEGAAFAGSGRLAGQSGRPVTYTWTGRVSAVPGTPWLRLEATLRLPEPVRLAWPPELVLWLGTFSTMEDRQRQVWRGLVIAQPTPNASGHAGNDLPAVYWHDARAGAGLILLPDVSAMAWFKTRFLTYRCREKRVHEPAPRYGVGLVALEPADVELDAGEHTFAWWLWQAQAPQAPSSWQALRTLVDAAGALVPAAAPFPTGATSWGEFAGLCLGELQTPGTCWIEVAGQRGQRAYVEPAAAASDRSPAYLELMTQVDVLAPLARYLALHPRRALQAHYDALRASLPGFHRAEIHAVSNRFPLAGEEVADAWYPFENALVKLAWLADWTCDPALAAIAGDALAGATAMAHRVSYLFPLFYNTVTLAPVGGLTNYALGGFYAYAHLLARGRPGAFAADHLAEARTAIAAMRRLPPDLLHHEPQELGFAALAAALLAETGEAGTWREAAQGFLAAQLRMGYWYSDPFARRNGYDNQGMFQACAGLLYPALKENVESVLPWPALLKRDLGGETLLKFLNLQRANDFYFFDPCLRPELRQAVPCPHIPYENLGTLELPSFGSIGKEIYGAGEVVWLYLMFEALGSADDREVLVVYLDLLEPVAAYPPADREFLVYNPTPTPRACRFKVPHLSPGRYAIAGAGSGERLYAARGLARGVPMTLEPGEMRRVLVQMEDRTCSCSATLPTLS